MWPRLGGNHVFVVGKELLLRGGQLKSCHNVEITDEQTVPRQTDVFSCGVLSVDNVRTREPTAPKTAKERGNSRDYRLSKAVKDVLRERRSVDQKGGCVVSQNTCHPISIRRTEKDTETSEVKRKFQVICAASVRPDQEVWVKVEACRKV